MYHLDYQHLNLPNIGLQVPSVLPNYLVLHCIVSEFKGMDIA